MSGSWGMGGVIAVVLLAALVVALAFAASPLIAVVLALVLGVPMLFGMVALRRREDTAGDAERPVTPEGKPTSPTGSRSGGRPAAGGG
jgi:hypothetical protein